MAKKYTICPQTSTTHLILIFTSILVLGFRYIFLTEILSKAKLHHLWIIFLGEMYTKRIYSASASSISHQQDWCFTEYYRKRNSSRYFHSKYNTTKQPSTYYSLCAPKTLWLKMLTIFNNIYELTIYMAQCVLFSIIRVFFSSIFYSLLLYVFFYHVESAVAYLHPPI